MLSWSPIVQLRGATVVLAAVVAWGCAAHAGAGPHMVVSSIAYESDGRVYQPIGVLATIGAECTLRRGSAVISRLMLSISDSRTVTLATATVDITDNHEDILIVCTRPGYRPSTRIVAFHLVGPGGSPSCRIIGTPTGDDVRRASAGDCMHYDSFVRLDLERIDN